MVISLVIHACRHQPPTVDRQPLCNSLIIKTLKSLTMKQFNFLFLFTFLILNQINAQTGCPGCVTDLPILPEDTIFLANTIDGEVGVYYDGNLSFRMPKTTDPVNANDPSTPAGLNISEITIISLVNVPPGLSWEPNQTVFDTSEETDGCLKFCGTPLVSDTFEIGVVVEAQIAIITQPASFTFKMYIAPASSSNDGFSATNTQGCGEIEVDFTNNVPSNGQDGFTYVWDFGNGMTSTSEQPTTQIYDEPGEYFVNYEASIDTTGFLLTSVDILADDCGDLIGSADLFIRLRNPVGDIIFSTNPTNNTQLPTNIPVNIILSGNGDYKLEVRDEDPFSTEECGDIYFTMFEGGIQTDGGLEVNLNIFNPIFTVTSTDTIVVLEEPDLPTIQQSLSDPLCSGTAVELMTDYLENIQWYKDTTLIFSGNDPTFTVTESGIYWVQYTADNGCQVLSEVTEIEYYPSPATPTHSYFENLLSINNEDNLPENYAAQWSFDGVEIPFADELFWCMQEDGNYTLTIVNEDNGCVSSYSFSYIYNPELDCIETGTQETLAAQIGLAIFPNPSDGLFNLNFNLDKTMPVSMAIYNMQGRVIWSKNEVIANEFSEALDLLNRPSGVYFLRMIVGEELVTERLVIQ
ncbi:MAG: hypothetical protein ACI9XO_000118 [Paraglaciecola sp.]|jgi:hypothetical protein